MQNAPFTVQQIDRTVTFTDDEGGHVDELDEGTPGPADLREALAALSSQCWDSLDERGDGTIICYPADASMNLRTGASESTQLIVKARRPEWADRLIALHRAGL